MNPIPKDILDLLNDFQEGYTQRNIENLDEFMNLFADSPDLLVIGTSATTQGEGEWCQGLEDVRELIEGDWLYWGNVNYQFEDAIISLVNECACISTTAEVTQAIPFEERYDDYIEFVSAVINHEKSTSMRKLIDITLLGNEVMASVLNGKEGSWPLRLSMTLVKQKGKWKILHLHYSFPCTRSPDVVS